MSRCRCGFACTGADQLYDSGALAPSIEIDYLLDCEADFILTEKKKQVAAGSITLINAGIFTPWSPGKYPVDTEDKIHGISLFISYEF